ncbi:hypothetical protein HA49_22590 [Tatumella morbirosei]|uniref:Glycosyl transferase family 1 domain-containing protein n=1 Tax=Tatumella morbirosei TaxID=642227 RepID=A0A0F5BW16_9GAMM|nr:hypothetical protein [Tatumella morbirosei]KKA63546.1 hypothetical protein HA49_22590 [Tatumella morbirosei]
MRVTISYFPKKTLQNAYSSRMLQILSDDFNVDDSDLKSITKELVNFNFSKKEVVILNWFENSLINNQGKVTLKKVILTYIKFIILKLKYKKLIYVKHNVFPHSTDKKYINNAIRHMALMTRFSNVVIVHSPASLLSDEKYVPHPLYSPVRRMSGETKDESLFVIFGRIARYKKIEDVILHFPKNKKLLVIGPCDDVSYLNLLINLSNKLPNVRVVEGFMNDHEVVDILSSASRMLITHSDTDMIVSGSFFYAIANNIPVFAIETPFLKWAENRLASSALNCFSNLDDLMVAISGSVDSYTYSQKVKDVIKREFGDAVVRSRMRDVINCSLKKNNH